MMTHAASRFWLLSMALLLPATVMAPAADTYTPVLKIETEVSFTTNLVHWVDNLAGSSVGKTLPVYRRYWEDRFGPPDAEDRRLLDNFARIRLLRLPAPERKVGNIRGCLPVATDGMGWHQIFLSEAMAAHSIADLRRGLSPYLSESDLDGITDTLTHFKPRFEKVWKDLGHVRRFEGRFKKFMAEGRLPAFLDSLAGFFEVDARAAPPMKISFVGLPVNGSTHAEADGDRLLIEIRPSDGPIEQIQVVAHEASHFLMRRMSSAQIDELAAQIYRQAESGPLVWRYMWEGLPTALGQGLAQARLSPMSASRSRRWYHIDSIDRFARLIFPAVEAAVGQAQGISRGLMPVIAGQVERSELMQEARASEFLMTAFYASGNGMTDAMDRMRERLGLGWDIASAVFELGDPRARDLLQRYLCLGGVALVSSSELETASMLDGEPALAPEVIQEILAQNQLGHGVIATGRRAGGGTIYFLVAPEPALASRLTEGFTHLRGLPERMVVLSPPAVGAPQP